jgi:1A family penicillin-binding protein
MGVVHGFLALALRVGLGARRRALPAVLLAVAVLAVACGPGAAPGSNLVTDADYAECLDKIRTNALPEVSYVYDRHGALLATITNPDEGLRIVLTADEIPLLIKHATVAAEDRFFYEHPGYDMRAISRAFMQNQQAGEVVSGGSTITQQLVKNICLTSEQTYERKLKEVNLAARLTSQFSRESILTFYLNKVYYGSQAYGIEAAATIFFGKKAMKLTLAEAAMLAGLTQSPSQDNPYTNLERAKARQRYVLEQMVVAGYISQAELEQAFAEPLGLARLRQSAVQVENQFDEAGKVLAPHFVQYVRDELAAQYGAQRVRQGGLHIHTTLDLTLQQFAEEFAQAHIATLEGYDVTNASVVAILPKSGEILTMVGSLDFHDEAIDGQVNVALAPRQPGSSLKPLFYAAAFEKGWTPATTIWDIPITIEIENEPDYRPRNFSGKFKGPVTVRHALANSFNVAAVRMGAFLGLDTAIDTMQRLGMTTFENRSRFGPSIVLGGGEVRLLELTNAYSVLARGGTYIPVSSIRRVEDARGNVLQRYELPAVERVFDPRIAYQITSILSDSKTRASEFGPYTPLDLTRPAAAKTGTTDNNRDGWTIGYTPQLVAGVWVGNADGSPTLNLTGMRGATPIWNAFMEAALANERILEFTKPRGLVEVKVCTRSGMLPTPYCGETHEEIFLSENTPKVLDNIFVPFRVHKVTGMRAGPNVPAAQTEVRVLMVVPEEAVEWAKTEGVAVAPTQEHGTVSDDAVVITHPYNGATVRSILEIRGNAFFPDFQSYEVAYASLTHPETWIRISHSTVPTANAVLGAWDTIQNPDGMYMVRLQGQNSAGRQITKTVTIEVQNTAAPPADSVFILSPRNGDTVRSILEVRGTASFPGFQSFEVAYAGQDNPDTWVNIAHSTEPKSDAVLAAWDTIQNPDGVYVVRLTAQNTAGKQQSQTVTITIQNGNGAAPSAAAADSQ